MVNTRIIRAHLRLIPSLISAWSTEWLQIIFQSTSHDAQSSISRFFDFCIRSDLLRLWVDQRSTIVRLLSTQLERCSIQRKDSPWNNKGGKERGQIESFSLTCYWCLSRIAYYLQEIHIGDFKYSQTKTILSCSFVYEGSSPSMTFSWHIHSSGSFSFSGLQKKN